MAFALLEGKPVMQLPTDLYIPPDALKVILEAFEGPLDLLLYLIKRQNLDILNIQVAEITRQYMQYIELMRDMQWDLAADYLVMAALLAEIKSRTLLPQPGAGDADEDDPKAELIRRLQEYERYKQAALDVDGLHRLHRNFWIAHAAVPFIERVQQRPEVKLQEMLLMLGGVLKRAEKFSSHRIELEPLSTRERMSLILHKVRQSGTQFVPFVALFSVQEGRSGVAVTFLALLELMKESLLEIVQTEPFSPIHVRLKQQLKAVSEQQPQVQEADARSQT